jgi:coproporphyrinogen III oxidase-like Fe-S oxidoreductase
LSVARFQQEFGEPPRHFYSDAIDAMRNAGFLLEDADGNLRLTPSGRLLADSVFGHFV